MHSATVTDATAAVFAGTVIATVAAAAMPFPQYKTDRQLKKSNLI